MKKIISFFLLMAVSTAALTQQTDPSAPLTKQDYLKRSRGQRTAAFILLGGGGIALASVSGGNTSFKSLGTIVVLGSAAVLGSIPLFIAAGKNKRKAMSMAFKNEMVPYLTNRSFTKMSCPSLTIKIGL